MPQRFNPDTDPPFRFPRRARRLRDLEQQVQVLQDNLDRLLGRYNQHGPHANEGWRHNNINAGPLPIDDPGNWAEVEADVGTDFDESWATNASILLWNKADPTTEAALLFLAWRNFGPGPPTGPPAQPTYIRIREAEITIFTLTAASGAQSITLNEDGIGCILTDTGTKFTVSDNNVGGQPILIVGADRSVTIKLGSGKNFEVVNSSGAAIFRVDEDGDLHGKTGKALTFDL